MPTLCLARVVSGVGVSDLVLTLCLARIDSGVGVSYLVLMLSC